MKQGKVKDMLAELGIIEKRLIKKEEINEENKNNVFELEDGFYLFDDNGLSDEDIKLAILARQASDISVIKSLITFWGLIILVGLALVILFIR